MAAYMLLGAMLASGLLAIAAEIMGYGVTSLIAIAVMVVLVIVLNVLGPEGR